MKIMLALLLLCAAFCARAEDGEYTPPSERWGFWQKIVPTLENIPYIDTTHQRDFLNFEGCEYRPSVWGTGLNSDRLVWYWSQWGIRESRWKFGGGLLFGSPAGNNTLPVASNFGLLAFFTRDF